MASPRESGAQVARPVVHPASSPVVQVARPVVHPAPTPGTQLVHSTYRRHHFHDVPPWPHQRYHDYAYAEGWGWWPRWFPYWDRGWYDYWWSLYDYYGGDAYPEYAEYARDAVLRQYAPQWGLVVSGSYGGAQVGMQPYGVSPTASRPAIYGYLSIALEAAKKISGATGQVLIGYRYTPWGSEVTAFGTRAGLQRWANEQGADTDVWYAAAFDLGSSSSPFSEVAR